MTQQMEITGDVVGRCRTEGGTFVATRLTHDTGALWLERDDGAVVTRLATMQYSAVRMLASLIFKLGDAVDLHDISRQPAARIGSSHHRDYGQHLPGARDT